jgi:hypothetical protein
MQKPTRVRGAQRIEMILQGLNAGKSRRKIAAELGVDEGSVRRDLKILLLPEPYLSAILTGAPAEKYLRSERHKAAENAERLRLAAEKEAAEKSKWQRLSEEKLTGCHSNALARLLLRWLDTKLPAASYIEQLMEIVDRKNWYIGDQMATPSLNPPETLALCGLGDESGEMFDKIEFLASVLELALPLIAPEKIIRCRAIDKAMRVVQNPGRCPAELRP